MWRHRSLAAGPDQMTHPVHNSKSPTQCNHWQVMKLDKYIALFQHVDLAQLATMNDDDLASFGLPLGS
jgi:hypothetical protein